MPITIFFEVTWSEQTGNKDILLKVAKVVANRRVITVTSDHSTSVTINSVKEWKNAATEVAPIPKGFNLETLTNYLREIPCNLAMQDEEELVYSGTQKPVLKGRKMYQSMKLQMAEFGVAGTDFFFMQIAQQALRIKRHATLVLGFPMKEQFGRIMCLPCSRRRAMRPCGNPLISG